VTPDPDVHIPKLDDKSLVGNEITVSSLNKSSLKKAGNMLSVNATNNTNKITTMASTYQKRNEHLTKSNNVRSGGTKPNGPQPRFNYPSRKH